MIRTIRLAVAISLALSLMPRAAYSYQRHELYEGAAAASPTGAAVDGFAIALSADEPTSPLSGPIWVTVELRNVSGHTQAVGFGPRCCSYYFAIVNNETGAVVPREKYSTFGSDPFLGFSQVQANNSIYGRLRLDLLYHFTQAGTYSVRVDHGQPSIGGKGIILQSNLITIRITP